MSLYLLFQNTAIWWSSLLKTLQVFLSLNSLLYFRHLNRGLSSLHQARTEMKTKIRMIMMCVFPSLLYIFLRQRASNELARFRHINLITCHFCAAEVFSSRKEKQKVHECIKIVFLMFFLDFLLLIVSIYYI